MKKIESINDLTEGQEVYIKAKYYTQEDIITDYPIKLQFSKDEDDYLTLTDYLSYRLDNGKKVELFTTEPQEPLEMPVVGKEYEFSDDGENWTRRVFNGYYADFSPFDFIRPIQQPSEEELKFLELAEKFKDKYKLTEK